MSASRTVSSTELRTRFAARLSGLYGTEVPAYRILVEVAQEVNQRVIAREGAEAERLGSIDRVTAAAVSDSLSCAISSSGCVAPARCRRPPR